MKRSRTQVTLWNHYAALWALGLLALAAFAWAIALQVQINGNPTFANLTTSTSHDLMLLFNSASTGYNTSENIDANNFLAAFNILGMQTASGKAYGTIEFLFRFTTTFVGDDNMEAILAITIPPNRLHGLTVTQPGIPPSQLPLLFFGASDNLMYPQRCVVSMVETGTIVARFTPPVGAPIQEYQSQYMVTNVGDYYPVLVTGLP